MPVKMRRLRTCIRSGHVAMNSFMASDIHCLPLRGCDLLVDVV
jgi:hypothetical protein